MAAVNKVGTQLLVSPFMRNTARALAIAREESTAEVYRAALEPALNAMLKSNGTAQDLLVVLAQMGVDQERALEAMIEQKIRYSDLFTAEGPPKKYFPGKLEKRPARRARASEPDA